MSFCDGNIREYERPGLSYGTIEIGRAGTRHGMRVRIEGLTAGIQWRALLERAFDLAGRSTPVRPSEAGWWVAIICAQALADAASPTVLRPVDSAETAKQVWMRLEPARMLERAPAWPLVKLAPTTPWLDLRGETCLAHGPADSELLAYAQRLGVHSVADPVVLREMFELGVLQWSRPDPVSGRRQVIRAQWPR